MDDHQQGSGMPRLDSRTLHSTKWQARSSYLHRKACSQLTNMGQCAFCVQIAKVDCTRKHNKV